MSLCDIITTALIALGVLFFVACLTLTWVDSALESRRRRQKERKERLRQEEERLACNAGLLGSFFELHADSMQARQALIRESFIASQANTAQQSPNKTMEFEVLPCEPKWR
ncbi:MAG: hypothetical protein FWD27_04635 [Coriobacteriia bacterium]|nr:hypothetical protein [Coriobacteriia bacterium]